MDRLTECLAEAFPGSELFLFTDSMLAVKLLYGGPVDLIFIETELRRLDGFQLLERARQKCGEIPVYFVSGTDRYRALAGASGAAGYLRKPVTAEVVRSKVVSSPIPKTPSCAARKA